MTSRAVLVWLPLRSQWEVATWTHGHRYIWRMAVEWQDPALRSVEACGQPKESGWSGWFLQLFPLYMGTGVLMFVVCIASGSRLCINTAICLWWLWWQKNKNWLQWYLSEDCPSIFVFLCKSLFPLIHTWKLEVICGSFKNWKKTLRYQNHNKPLSYQWIFHPVIGESFILSLRVRRNFATFNRMS